MKTPRYKQTFSERAAEYIDSSLMLQRLKIGAIVCLHGQGRYGIYKVSARRKANGKFKNPQCTCPSDDIPCKHAVALAQTFLKKPESFYDADKMVAAKCGDKSSKELLSLIRKMIAVAPASLQALGVDGFEEVNLEEYYE